jgi:hypothetical protein
MAAGAVTIVPGLFSCDRQIDHAYVQPRTWKHPVSNLSRSIYEGCSVDDSWADVLQASHDARGRRQERRDQDEYVPKL